MQLTLCILGSTMVPPGTGRSDPAVLGLSPAPSHAKSLKQYLAGKDLWGGIDFRFGESGARKDAYRNTAGNRTILIINHKCWRTDLKDLQRRRSKALLVRVRAGVWPKHRWVWPRHRCPLNSTSVARGGLWGAAAIHVLSEFNLTYTRNSLMT